MSETDALQGLSCPRCGGMVPIPEGEAIVTCPFCELRSVVSGERGVRRYQVPTRVTREQAEAAYKRFLSSNLAIARSAASQAQISEVLLVHLPFWAVWGQVAAWLFGYRRVKSGDSYTNVPKEERVAESMAWNAAACDVGEFGVTQISLEGRRWKPSMPKICTAPGWCLSRWVQPKKCARLPGPILSSAPGAR